MYNKEIFNVLKLTLDNLKFKYKEEVNNITFLLNESIYHIFVLEGIIITRIYPNVSIDKCDENILNNLNNFINKINTEFLVVGNFRYLKKENLIRYEIYLDCEDLELQEKMIIKRLLRAIHTVEVFLPGIDMISKNGMNANDAINVCIDILATSTNNKYGLS